MWRHCCLECRYPVDQPEDEAISIRYLDSNDDFEIVAGELTHAFRLLQASGWQLAAVTRGQLAPRHPRRVVPSERLQVDRYYFKRAGERRD